MKKKTFNIWTDLVEKFLNDIATPTVSYQQLSDHMDTKGFMDFYLGQNEYYKQHSKDYPPSSDTSPPSIRTDLPSEQIAAGFDKVFAGILAQFPDLKENANELFVNLKKDCLAPKFFPFILARAGITLNIKPNDPNPMQTTIESFQFLIEAAKASIASIEEFRLMMPPKTSTLRAPSSSAMYKIPAVQATGQTGETPGLDKTPKP